MAAKTKTEGSATDTGLPRRFLYNGAELEDPDQGMSPKQVQEFYAAHYPELTNANPVMEIKTVNGTKVAEWTFKKATGTKG